MPSRRALLRSLPAAATAAVAGCGTRARGMFATEPPVTGPCDGPDAQWPTAGGDPGRTGRTDSAPPDADAELTDLLAGVTVDGRRPLAGSLPAVGRGLAYVPSASGVVAIPLDASTDGPAWNHDLDDDVDAVPALGCGVVLVAGLNALVALDPETGERYWRADVGGHGETTVAFADETVYAAGVDPVALDVYTGAVGWRATGGDTLAVDADGVYSTRNVNGTGGIFAHDHDGTRRWHLSLGKIVASATVDDGTVLVPDTRGTVYAIDATTGETHWSRSLDGVRKVFSGLAVRDSDVVVPAGTGETSAVLDADTGKPRWTVDTGIVTGRPVIGDDWVAFGRTNVGVSVYDRATGTHRVTWSREAYDIGTVSGIVPVDDGFVIRGGTTSGLGLLR
ncbi:MAG: PQQ-binding-like beta-propeller repeat protein [Haloarculaceae archaeon]